jgi:PAS domain S-box-containing protein
VLTSQASSPPAKTDPVSRTDAAGEANSCAFPHPGWTEADRLAALDRYRILDTPPESIFDDIVRLVAQICKTPVALFGLFADGRVWFKGKIGYEICETPLEASICSATIEQKDLFVISDLSKDSRFADFPIVASDPHFRFYAGLPLITEAGYPIGTLCTLDYAPRDLSAEEAFAIKALGRQMMMQLELRRALVWQESDVAQLRKTEEFLRKTEEFRRELNATLEQQIAERTRERDRMWFLSQDLLLVARFDGTIVAANPAWHKILGWREEDLLERSIFDFIHLDDRATAQDEHDQILRGLPGTRVAIRHRHANGTYRLLSWTTMADDGFIHAIGRDITPEHDTAQALQRAEEALRQSQKMEAIGQLTGGIAHDFNNILTGIVGSLELMQRRIAAGRTAEIGRYVDAAITSANRAAALTHRLLAFARRQSLDPKSIDVNHLVVSMEDLLRRTLGENIAIETALEPALWPAFSDANQLESALLNLIINSRDAMPEGGKLTIITRNAELIGSGTADEDGFTPGDYVEISIADTGTGMSPEVLEKVFDPFFTTKPIGQGTGLGLSMIYGFVRQSNGHIHIDSMMGHGTVITLYLPRHYEAEDQVSGNASPSEAPRAQTGETVLVIEDEEAVRMLVIEVLQELGYTTIQAIDSKTALPIFESDQRIDLLVTDVGLPGLNGRQLAEIARQQRPGLRVLFMTGYTQAAAMRRGFLETGMEMITKPFTVDALATRVREMLCRVLSQRKRTLPFQAGWRGDGLRLFGCRNLTARRKGHIRRLRICRRRVLVWRRGGGLRIGGFPPHHLVQHRVAIRFFRRWP